METKTSNLLPAISDESQFDFLFCKLCNTKIKGGNRRFFASHLRYAHKTDIRAYYKMFWEVQKCECGCNNNIEFGTWKKFIHGHNVVILNKIHPNIIQDGTPFVIDKYGVKKTAMEIECCICKKTTLRAKSYVNQIKQRNGKLTCSKGCKKILSREQRFGKILHSKNVPVIIDSRGWHLEAVEVTCSICDTPFMREKSYVKFGNIKHKIITCSKKCWAIWAKKRMQGSNSPCWRGGITPKNAKIRASDEYKKWRKSVYERDDYVCQMCFKKGNGDLVGHHILKFSDYKDYRFEVWNGITLCEHCHEKTYGKEKSYVTRFIIYTCGEPIH